MTSIASGKQTGATAMQMRVRTARPVKLKSTETAFINGDSLSISSGRLNVCSEFNPEATLVSPVVPIELLAHDVNYDQTEKLLLELDALWADADAPLSAYLLQSENAIREQSLIDRLNDISQYHTGIGSEIAESIETELGEMDAAPADNRLGHLLVELSLITTDLLEHSILLSNEYSISLGRVLIMSGWITGKQLQWAIQLQALLKDGLISKEGAVQVADLMGCAGMTMQRALNCAGFPHAMNNHESRGTRIGDLLIDADIISSDEFHAALLKSQALGMQVGRFLMISRLVAEPLLETVSNAQRFLRQNKISREDAIVAIKCAAHRQKELRESAAPPIYATMPLKTIRLGELLSLAGIISESHIEHAVEFGLRCNIAVGQVLIDLEIISKRTLDTALTLQELVAGGSIEAIDAAYALIDVHHHGFALEKALKRNRGMLCDRKVLSFEQFLASMEVISISQIEESIETARRSPLFISKALVLSGALSDETVQVALLCHFYVRENMLSTDESLLLFNLCHRTGISVEDGLTELGLTIRRATAA
ncbi:MAG: hypothetical protein SGJ27_24550 [Candidatus Melainabacteria bacterium]|nr:hypothetical protein [Candidatus Melainabacteria bacterium]